MKPLCRSPWPGTLWPLALSTLSSILNLWLNDWDPPNCISLFSLFWKNLEAHCFHYFLTDIRTKQSENSENSVSFQILPKQWQQCELPDSSKAVTTVWASRFFQNSDNIVSFQILPKQWQQCELPDSSKTVKTVWASRFFQNSDNSVSFQILPKQWKQCELPDSSKTVTTVWASRFFQNSAHRDNSSVGLHQFVIPCNRQPSLLNPNASILTLNPKP